MKMLLQCWSLSAKHRGLDRLRETWRLYQAVRWLNNDFLNESRFSVFSSPWHMLAREDMRRAYEEGRFKPLGGEKCL